MKILKVIATSTLVLVLSSTSLFADYNKGFKYYKKYIKKKTHLKAPQFVKILGVKTQEELDTLFKNNGKPLIERLKKLGQEKAAKAVEKIIKKHKLKDLKDFLDGIIQGKIPAGCS